MSFAICISIVLSTRTDEEERWILRIASGVAKSRVLLFLLPPPPSTSDHHPAPPSHHPAMAIISDMALTGLANGLGALAVLLIVVYQFVEVNDKREKEAIARGERGGAPVEVVL